MGESLGSKVERHTRAPAAAPSSDPRDLVLVRPGEDLEAGFALAERLLRTRGGVRLIAHGATLPITWPPSARTARGLLVTELGAYRHGSTLDITASLRETYRAWAAEVLAGAAPAGSAADVFTPTLCSRLFQGALDAHVLLSGVHELHPGAEIHSPAGHAAPGPTGGSATTAGSATRALLPAALLAASAAGAAYAVAWAVRHQLEARASYSALAERRSAGEPHLWVAVVPDWYRANKHLIEAVALPELRGGGVLGVLLLGTLRVGMRDEATMKARSESTELWPGLGELRPLLDRCVVDQAVQPATAGAAASAIFASLYRSTSVAIRMARSPGPLRDLARADGVLSVASRAARAATLDVFRSTLAERATEAFARKHAVRDRIFVFAGANSAGYSSVDELLRRSGAVTVEHMHGSGGGYWHGTAESHPTYRCVWTRADARALASAPHRCLVAGMPQTTALRARTAVVPRRVLLLTNYVHRDWAFAGRFPGEPFLHELLRVAAELRAAHDDVLEFRWRPHPADNPAALERALARAPDVELSRGRSLAEDLDWCDVLVSGQSTALVEAVLGGVPSFVHVTPEYEDDLDWVPSTRTFFHAEDIVEPFLEWVRALRRGDAIDVEADARRALFGPEGRPVTLREALADVSPPRGPSGERPG